MLLWLLVGITVVNNPVTEFNMIVDCNEMVMLVIVHKNGFRDRIHNVDKFAPVDFLRAHQGQVTQTLKIKPRVLQIGRKCPKNINY